MSLIRNQKSFVVGSIALVPPLALRFASSANFDNVWLFGSEIHIGCWFRDEFGIPCPFCGMTRSVLLTLSFDVESASQA